MCTLLILHRCLGQLPLVVGANRDEYLDRPAEAPRLGRSGPRRILAPRDLRAGGSWLGVSDAGLFAALTNRPCLEPDPGRPSRGLLVLEALAHPSASQAALVLERLPDNAYNPFNLLVADGREAFALVYEDKPAVTELAPGAHVVGNADPDDRRQPKLARLLERVEDAASAGADAVFDALAAICSSHDGVGLEPACVHAGGYGTRSSTLLGLAAQPAGCTLRHAEGPPCRAAYEDFTPLLLELWPEGRRAAGGGSARRMR